LGSSLLNIQLAAIELNILEGGDGLFGRGHVLKGHKGKAHGVRSTEDQFAFLSTKSN
jgi:hypothetical protein